MSLGELETRKHLIQSFKRQEMRLPWLMLLAGLLNLAGSMSNVLRGADEPGRISKVGIVPRVGQQELSRSCICPQVYAPVCLQQHRFSNACVARCSNVSDAELDLVGKESCARHSFGDIPNLYRSVQQVSSENKDVGR